MCRREGALLVVGTDRGRVAAEGRTRRGGVGDGRRQRTRSTPVGRLRPERRSRRRLGRQRQRQRTHGGHRACCRGTHARVHV